MPPARRTAHKEISWLLIGVLLGVFGLLATVLLPTLVRADDSPGKPPRSQSNTDDADLMEFLGGIGSEDENLIKFLGRTDPRKIAAASAPKPSPPTSAQSSSADPGSQKQ